jgi:hypothetical protein
MPKHDTFDHNRFLLADTTPRENGSCQKQRFDRLLCHSTFSTQSDTQRKAVLSFFSGGAIWFTEKVSGSSRAIFVDHDSIRAGFHKRLGQVDLTRHGIGSIVYLFFSGMKRSVRTGGCREPQNKIRLWFSGAASWDLLDIFCRPLYPGVAPPPC